jgi:DNA helicase-2/ATP-dependent DNA helicase PcrA
VSADSPRVYAARPREVASSARDYSAELNPAQLRAATHEDGPLLVIAGAGTGKTRTLVYRVAHLIDRGVAPERILLLTFTRRAAQEMLSRAERLVGSASRRVQGGTFHATGNRLLRAHGEQAGLPRDFTIMDPGDAEDLMGIARAALGFATKSRRFPKKETLHAVYSAHINTERTVEEILERDLPGFAADAADIVRVFADYVARKAERNLVDYDDLLLFWALMLEQSPALAERIAGAYDHVLVDEYQDTNLLQARILRGMCAAHRNLTVVGDDAQSIYSFRGATIENILRFPAQFPGASVVTLEHNYRSSQPILDVSNTLISRAERRYTKELYTERTGGERPWLVAAKDESQQTRFVVDRILELHEAGTPLREIAVLFRAGYMSADLEIELANRKIPFEKWGGLKFLEAAHVKDVLAFLRILENPRDEVSWFRILNLLPGIGDATARAAIGYLAERGWDVEAFGEWVPPGRAREAHAQLASLLARLRMGHRSQPDLGAPADDEAAARTSAAGDASDGGGPAPDAPPSAAAPSQRISDVSLDIAEIRTLYDDILRERYDRPEPRLADVEQLQLIAGGYPSRAAFLAAIALEPPQGTQDLAGGSEEEGDVLVLSTAHSAKGKEWDAVFLVWAADGWFPSARAAGDDEELEEERRLMYVALTRARHQLAVVYPQRAYDTRRSASYTIDQLSRFIDRGVRHFMQLVALEDEEPEPAAAPQGAPPLLDLRALLRGKFGG